MSKRSSPLPDDGAPSKRARTEPGPGLAPSVHAWLHPSEPAPLIAHSRALHASSSTFASFTLSFTAAAHVSSPAALTKQAARVVRDLDVVGLLGPALLEAGEGAFQDGQGRAIGRAKGKERAREPDHRMWAVRTLGLKEGKNGTGGEGDYQLLEAFNDDNEKYGGERVMRVLRDARAVDVLTVCCRWFGGDMLGPARFQHIAITAHDSLADLLKLVALRDLRLALVGLDDDIAGLRATVAAAAGTPTRAGGEAKRATYDDIGDVGRLERLVAAKEKTRKVLEDKVGWAALEQTRADGS
ncbi:hypothetical protein Q5752_001707 [Cryptotrichosporon argae]